MTDGGIELTPRETTALNVIAWFLPLGAILGSLVTAWLEHWWPVACFVGSVVAVFVGFSLYLARTRRRSFTSVLREKQLLPQRPRMIRSALVMVPIAVASFAAGIIGGHEPYQFGSALLLGAIGAWCGARLVASLPETMTVRGDRYPFDIAYLINCGLLLLDAVFELVRGETIVEWSAGVWSLPLGVLMVIAEVRRWRLWRTLPDDVEPGPSSDTITATEG